LRPLSFQMRAVNLIRCAWLIVFQKKVVAKSRSRDFFHWMEIRLYACFAGCLQSVKASPSLFTHAKSAQSVNHDINTRDLTSTHGQIWTRSDLASRKR
jgi:hypothetical protein